MAETTLHRMVRHWRGEASAAYALLLAPLLALVPFGLTIVVVQILKPAELSPMWRAVSLVFLVAANALIVWWCVGVMRKSLDLLSSQYLFFSMLLFALGFSAQLSWGLTLLPLSMDLVHEMLPQADVADTHARTDKDLSHPWTVYADPNLHRLVGVGRIGWGSTKALEAVLLAYPEMRVLQLESFGGLTHEEQLLIDLVHQRGLDTLVLGKCASACTGVFLAGERLFLGADARLGFHQSGYKGRPNDTEWSIEEYELSIMMNERGVSDEFAQRVLQTSYYDLWKPDALTVKQSGYATAWWMDRPFEYR